MRIENDDIDLTGDRIINGKTDASVIRYITFTASSVSETSELTYRINTEEEWEVSVSLVRCTKDEARKTYAIRIECPFFTVSDPANKTREVIIEGFIRTNIQSVFSSVYESFLVTGCVDPYVYLMYKTSDGITIEPHGNDGFDVIPIGNEPVPNSGGWCRFIFDEAPTLIKAERFVGRATLIEIITPSSIATISSYAFAQCSGLTAVTLNNGLDIIESRAFRGCSGLTSINIPNSVTTIGRYAFSGCGLTDVMLNTGLTEISEGVFAHNDYLERINIPNSITAIGASAFTGCYSLTSISIPDSVEIIGDNAFNDCYNISNLNIPNSVITIGTNAFYRIQHITYNGPCIDDGNHWGALSKN